MDFSGLLALRDLFDKDKIAKYADTLPTAEQNIERLKSGALGLLSKAQDGASALQQQAMQAYQNYMNPPQPPQPTPPLNPAHYEAAVAAPEPRYLAPDNSGDMWTRDQIEAYYAMLHQQMANQLGTGAPTRAAFRKRQQGLLGQ